MLFVSRNDPTMAANMPTCPTPKSNSCHQTALPLFLILTAEVKDDLGKRKKIARMIAKKMKTSNDGEGLFLAKKLIESQGIARVRT